MSVSVSVERAEESQPFPKLSVEPRDCANLWDLSNLWQTFRSPATPAQLPERPGDRAAANAEAS
jgi:hypothetical protein